MVLFWAFFSPSSQDPFLSLLESSLLLIFCSILCLCSSFPYCLEKIRLDLVRFDSINYTTLRSISLLSRSLELIISSSKSVLILWGAHPIPFYSDRVTEIKKLSKLYTTISRSSLLLLRISQHKSKLVTSSPPSPNLEKSLSG